MVADFLKRMRDNYDGLITTDKKSMMDLDQEYRENAKFLELLEAETQKVFRDFTPREIDNKNGRKIAELNRRQEEIEGIKNSLQSSIDHNMTLRAEILAAMEEVRELEMAAEDSKWYEENYYNPGTNEGDPDMEEGAHSLDPVTASKLETILSFLLSDPMRAKRELTSLLNNSLSDN